jgi:hypothetical protein
VPSRNAMTERTSPSWQTAEAGACPPRSVRVRSCLIPAFIVTPIQEKRQPWCAARPRLLLRRLGASGARSSRHIRRSSATRAALRRATRPLPERCLSRILPARRRWCVQEPPKAAFHLLRLLIGQRVTVISHARKDSDDPASAQ